MRVASCDASLSVQQGQHLKTPVCWRWVSLRHSLGEDTYMAAVPVLMKGHFAHKKHLLLGPYSRTIPRVLWWS